MRRERLAGALDSQRRLKLATLPTSLEPGPLLPGGARLYVKRDDLTGLGMGGNKARKLEFLCADALRAGADTLITVGAAQSNHARMTAAAGAVLGLQTHLVLGGPHEEPSGNQLLSTLFGARLHFPGTDDWDELGAAMGEVIVKLRSQGRRPYRMPIGGSTAVGARGFAAAWPELMHQCAALGIRPSAVIHASSSGGTHAGLIAGKAACSDARPEIVAIGVAKTAADLAAEARTLAEECLVGLGIHDVSISGDAAEVDGRWRGADYAAPTEEADRAILWAAHSGAWVLDRVYTGKAFAGLLGADREDRFSEGDAVVFWHTGGQPALFVANGAPDELPREATEGGVGLP
jgi:1-aminocyclopropane-1-carboxylate deaminase/D-cysteine desulfhydrase-like pyridoxal-dependent ACC family enzyme